MKNENIIVKVFLCSVGTTQEAYFGQIIIDDSVFDFNFSLFAPFYTIEDYQKRIFKKNNRKEFLELTLMDNKNSIINLEEKDNALLCSMLFSLLKTIYSKNPFFFYFIFKNYFLISEKNGIFFKQLKSRSPS